MTALLTATALTAACGDDEADPADGLSGGAGGAAGNGNGGNGNTGNTVLNFGGDGVGTGGLEGQGGDCGQTPFEADPVVVNILLVIDKSDSMNADLGTGSRWDAMETAINATVDASADAISYGMLLYPDDATCGVPSAPDVAVQSGADAVGAINDALAASDPSGSTPTALALDAAFAYFDSGPGADLEGLKYVLLATDGGPNCHAGGGACDIEQCTQNIEEAFNPGSYPVCDNNFNCCDVDDTQCLDDADTIAAVTQLEAAGVQTIVVGIPGTEAYADLLDDVAVAGGSPNPNAPPSYYVVEEGDATGLQDVLESITMGLIRECEFQLNEEPPDLDGLRVYVGTEEIDYDPDRADGWNFSDPETHPPTVVLLGATCDEIMESGASNVSIVYDCAMPPR